MHFLLFFVEKWPFLDLNQFYILKSPIFEG